MLSVLPILFTLIESYKAIMVLQEVQDAMNTKVKELLGDLSECQASLQVQTVAMHTLHALSSLQQALRHNSA